MGLFEEGMKFFKDKKFSEAIIKFHSAIDEDDQNPKIWNALGVSYSKIGQYDDAETCFENALLLDPNNLSYLKNQETIQAKIKTKLNISNNSSSSKTETHSGPSNLVSTYGYPKLVLYGVGGLFLIFILLSVIGSFSPDASKEIEQSRLIYNNGIERILNVDYSQGMTQSNQLEATKTEFQQAIKILTDAKTSNSDQKKTIEIYKLIGDSSIKIADAEIEMLKVINSLNKLGAYENSNDYQGAREELRQTKVLFSNVVTQLSSAKSTANAIDQNNAYPEIRGFIVNLQKGLNNLDNFKDFTTLFDGVDLLYSGMEHLKNADKYIAMNDASNTKQEISDAKSDFGKAKPIFDSLKNSQIIVISTLSIQKSSAIDQVNNALSQIEQWIIQNGY